MARHRTAGWGTAPVSWIPAGVKMLHNAQGMVLTDAAETVEQDHAGLVGNDVVEIRLGLPAIAADVSGLLALVLAAPSPKDRLSVG